MIGQRRQPESIRPLRRPLGQPLCIWGVSCRTGVLLRYCEHVQKNGEQKRPTFPLSSDMLCYIQVSGSSVIIESHLRSIGIRMALSRFQSRGSNTVNTMRSSALIKLSAHRSHCSSGIPYRLQCVSMERIHSLTSVYGGRYVWRCQSLRIALIARSGSWYGMSRRKREKESGRHTTNTRSNSRKCSAGVIQYVTKGRELEAYYVQSVFGFLWAEDMDAAFAIRTSF